MIHKIQYNDIAGGAGWRTTVWFAGCPLRCPGCHNPELWDPDSGDWLDFIEYRAISDSMEEHGVTGLNLLGGEPLADWNLREAEILAELAAGYGRDTWVWTGYGFEEALERAPWMRDPGHNVRMVIAGPYVQEKRDTSIPYMGSSNQQAWMRVGVIWFDVTGIKNPVTKGILNM